MKSTEDPKAIVPHNSRFTINCGWVLPVSVNLSAAHKGLAIMPSSFGTL